MKFNEKIACLRKEKHFSQEELAEKLSVSRQAVSKWESGSSYPEMDKLLLMCKIFDCNLEELTSEKITIEEMKDKELNKINGVIDEILDCLSKTYELFHGLSFFKCVKLLIKLILTAGVVGVTLFIPILIIADLGRNFFFKLGKIGSILSSLWLLILAIGAIVFYIIVMFYIYKTVFLGKYEFIQESEKEENEIIEFSKEKIETKKVIIRRSEEKGSVVIKCLERLFTFFGKCVIFLTLLPFIVSFIIFVVLFTLDIYLIFKGVMFLGVLLGLIACLILNFILILILSSWLASKKVNFKYNLILFIISLVLGGISFGVLTLEIADINLYNEAPNETIDTETIKLKYEKDLVIRSYYASQFVYEIDNSLKDNEILITYTHYKDYTDIKTSYEGNVYYIALYYSEVNNKYIDLIINDLKNKEIYDYEKLRDLKIVIKARENVIDKLQNNSYDEDKISECDYNVYIQEKEMLNDTISELENELKTTKEEYDELLEQNNTLEDSVIKYEKKLEELRNLLN